MDTTPIEFTIDRIALLHDVKIHISFGLGETETFLCFHSLLSDMPPRMLVPTAFGVAQEISVVLSQTQNLSLTNGRFLSFLFGIAPVSGLSVPELLDLSEILSELQMKQVLGFLCWHVSQSQESLQTTFALFQKAFDRFEDEIEDPMNVSFRSALSLASFLGLQRRKEEVKADPESTRWLMRNLLWEEVIHGGERNLIDHPQLLSPNRNKKGRMSGTGRGELDAPPGGGRGGVAAPAPRFVYGAPRGAGAAPAPVPRFVYGAPRGAGAAPAPAPRFVFGAPSGANTAPAPRFGFGTPHGAAPAPRFGFGAPPGANGASRAASGRGGFGSRGGLGRGGFGVHPPAPGRAGGGLFGTRFASVHPPAGGGGFGGRGGLGRGGFGVHPPAPGRAGRGGFGLAPGFGVPPPAPSRAGAAIQIDDCPFPSPADLLKNFFAGQERQIKSPNVELRSVVDQRSCRTHIELLLTSYEFFRLMMRGNWSERDSFSQTRVIKLEELSSASLGMLATFAYVGRFSGRLVDLLLLLRHAERTPLDRSLSSYALNSVKQFPTAGQGFLSELAEVGNVLENLVSKGDIVRAWAEQGEFNEETLMKKIGRAAERAQTIELAQENEVLREEVERLSERLQQQEGLMELVESRLAALEARFED